MDIYKYSSIVQGVNYDQIRIRNIYILHVAADELRLVVIKLVPGGEIRVWFGCERKKAAYCKHKDKHRNEINRFND